MEAKELINKIPLYVTRVSDVLVSNGYESYLVGGSVRDILSGITPQDYDIATNATPNEIENLFPKSISTGARFGTIIVLMEDEAGERFDVEVTTFRSESDYYGGRWPGKVEFAKTIEEDLSRRDFTINAVAINLKELTLDAVEDDFLVDPFNGRKDLNKKLVKAVGDALERFSEDGLRPIRACRFASTLGFEIEKETFEAIKKSNHITKMVAVERVKDELEKIILRSPKPSVGIRLLEETGILALYIPELIENKEVYQPEFHSDSVYEHSLKTLDLGEDSVKWAALFHDIGKARTKTEDETGIHFYGHDIKGAEMAKEIMKRLKFSNAEINKNTNLIRWHMFYYPSAEWRNSDEDTKDSKNLHGWSDAAIRRFIMNVGGEEIVDELIKLRIADATSNPKSNFTPDEIVMLQERIAEVKSKDMALKVTDLDITGGDLKEMGYQEGPVYKEILHFLLEKVIDDPLLNKKEILKKIVQENFKS